MSAAAAKEIVEAALKLDPQVRAEVAQEILDSIKDSNYGELSPAWEEELDRRVREIEEGRVQLVPATQVFAELEASLQTRRAGK
jgi:putative addiction module component (TIGR02574 family)